MAWSEVAQLHSTRSPRDTPAEARAAAARAVSRCSDAAVRADASSVPSTSTRWSGRAFQWSDHTVRRVRLSHVIV
jgi:hypothetical protein